VIDGLADEARGGAASSCSRSSTPSPTPATTDRLGR
jgi:hypothetical protein